MALFGGLFAKRTPIEEIERVWKGFRDYYVKLLDQNRARDPKVLQKKEIKDNLKKMSKID